MYRKLFENRQEAQLPLRNRASAMHFFVVRLLSIAVITETYVCYVRDLQLTKRLSYYKHTHKQQINLSCANVHATAALC